MSSPSWPLVVGPGAAVSIGKESRVMIWLQKRKLERKNERENEKKYQKTCPTCAWGRGIDWVVKTYPNPTQARYTHPGTGYYIPMPIPIHGVFMVWYRGVYSCL